MANQVFLSVLLVMCILKLGDGYYYHSGTTERMKSKIVYMDRELIKEAIRHVQKIEHMKDFYTVSPVYHIGQMLYFIRSKFARMVRLFVLSCENDQSFTNFHLHLPAMKELHHLGLEIYHLIEMLEEYEANPNRRIDNLEINKHGQRQKTKMNPRRKESFLRQRPINKPSLSNKGFYARKPNEEGRSGIMAKRTKDDALFESDFE